MKKSILNDAVIEHAPYTQLIISKTCPLHSHTFFEFSICLSGEYVNEINGNSYPIERGTILLLRPQDTHYFVCKDKHMSRDVYIHSQDLKQICDCINPTLFEQLSNTELAVCFKISDYDLQMLENKLNLFNNPKSFSQTFLKTSHASIIMDILTLWMQYKAELNLPDLPPWLSLLLARINTKEFLHMNVETIAEETNYSHGYVCREFKKHMGIPLKEHVANVKFSFATALLLSNENSVAQIAEKLNYSSTSNFIIAFKRKYGVTPLQWRKEQKKKSNKLHAEDEKE